MKHSTLLHRCALLVCATILTITSFAVYEQDAEAFCGFYVAGSNDDLYADATQVALMRGGTRTILSMENNYRGPLADFAMVVPVPEVLMQDQVKTLSPGLFRRLDRLTAPRLVQYWEKDPCQDNVIYRKVGECVDQNNVHFAPGGNNNTVNNTSSNNGSPNNVVVEAEFAVGEYEIVVLSSDEATSLESWLTTNNYNIPAGATEIFEQYIQQGMYFFVAKINPAKVTFTDGQAVLSPLRFHYTSETFSLPIRLGMINSAGAQDLIVYTIGGNQRYELANYPNATIPTNINVKPEVKEDFPAYYEKLFSRTLAENPGAVITEYAWSASGCDPCPVPPMGEQDLATLGADILIETGEGHLSAGFAITRLHARYGKQDIDEDLIFATAEPLAGGNGGAGKDQLQTQESWANNFQGRYIIHNRFQGELECEHEVRGRWTAPPPIGEEGGVTVSPGPNTTGQLVQEGLAALSLEELADEDVPATGEPLVITQRISECSWEEEHVSDPDITPEKAEEIQEDFDRPKEADAEAEGGCQSTPVGVGGAIPGVLLGALGFFGVFLRRRKSLDSRGN